MHAENIARHGWHMQLLFNHIRRGDSCDLEICGPLFITMYSAHKVRYVSSTCTCRCAYVNICDGWMGQIDPFMYMLLIIDDQRKETSFAGDGVVNKYTSSYQHAILHFASCGGVYFFIQEAGTWSTVLSFVSQDIRAMGWKE